MFKVLLIALCIDEKKWNLFVFPSSSEEEVKRFLLYQAPWCRVREQHYLRSTRQ
jgi:hypothetical protein